MKIRGETHYLWRAVDHRGEVLEAYVSKKRNREAALRFLRKTMKRYDESHLIVTDKLSFYGAALRELDLEGRQEAGRWLNNRAENSHLPLRRRERAMQRFRLMRSLQKFAAVHASVFNHFSHDRHINRRSAFKEHRAATLAECISLAWPELGASGCMETASH